MRRLSTLALIALVSCTLAVAPAAGRTHDLAPADHGLARPTASAPMIRVSPPPGIRIPLGSNANETSTNWSGYAAATNLTNPAGNSVSDVSGTWVVPTVTGGTTNAYCADWIGIDGFLSNTVEQLGTEEDWAGGSPAYYAWWEMYPAPSQSIPMAIHPGDVITAEVRWVSGNTFSLSLTDATTGATFSTQQQLGTTAARDSAEWIHEAPTSGIHVLPLAQTTPAKFSACDATINGTNGPIGNPLWQNAAIDMVSSSNVVLAQTSALSAAGTRFAVTPPGAPPDIWPTSPSLTFDYLVGGATPAAQSLAFANAGGGALNWSASSDSPSWLTCAPGSGGSGASTSVSVNPSLLAIGAHTGHLIVTASGADNTPLSIPVTLNVVQAPPLNDAFPGQSLGNALTGAVSGANPGATMQPGEPAPSSQPGATHSVWYAWTAPSTGTWEFDTLGSDFDTVLAAYVGNSVTSLVQIVSNDDFGGAHQSRAAFAAQGGATYFIQVTGAGGQTGNIALRWSPTSLGVSLSTPSVSSKPSHKRKTSFAGTTSPPHVVRLTLTFQKRSHGQWKTYGRAHVTTNSQGRWGYRIKLRAATYRLRTSSGAAQGYFAAVSAWRNVTVR